MHEILPLTSPPAQKARSPVPLISTKLTAGSASHFCQTKQTNYHMSDKNFEFLKSLQLLTEFSSFYYLLAMFYCFSLHKKALAWTYYSKCCKKQNVVYTNKPICCSLISFVVQFSIVEKTTTNL